MIPEVFRPLFKDLKTRMEKTLHVLEDELKTVRTGRASTHLFDHITVEYYGSPTPLSQVATLRIPEPNLVTITPWEPRMLAVIEKALRVSDLGVSPVNDGKTIKVPIPPLTEERRHELVRHVHKLAEEARTAIRMIRRDGNDSIKKMEKEKACSEDIARRGRDEVQKLTDEYIKKVEKIVKDKEQEILQ